MKHDSLPSNTFTSADAIQWLIRHVEGITNGDEALVIMEKMLKERLICHASGDFKHPFIVGFYLYHVCPKDKDSKGKFRMLFNICLKNNMRKNSH